MTTNDVLARRGAPVRATRGALPVMATAAALSVAGNYFAQPLLGVLRDDLGMTGSTAALTVGLAQVGYAVGLAVLVPLGDRFCRRGLVTLLLTATALFLAAGAASPTGWWLLAATVLAATTSVGAQVLVPFAAQLADPERRARAVATVMAGVLLGGIAGRAVSGLLADLAGWRTVYWITAVLLGGIAVLVRRVLPRQESDERAPLGTTVAGLLHSTAALLAEVPALRRPIGLAATVMAAYSVHLTTVTLLLADAPYRWSTSAIGLVALVGLVGPLSLPITGRLVDRGRRRAVVLVGLSLSTGAWGLMVSAGDGDVVWLLVGLAALNLGQQAVLNATATAAYDLRPDARSRVNALFMTLFFAGGAAGTASASFAWAGAGWTGACALGGALAAGGFLVALRRPANRRQVEGTDRAAAGSNGV